jgi:hypothetical protein
LITPSSCCIGALGHDIGGDAVEQPVQPALELGLVLRFVPRPPGGKSAAGAAPAVMTE